MQILITGAARSGTSLTAQICGALGANLGQVTGLYENLPIKRDILFPMIEAAGGDKLGQHPLPPMNADPGWSFRKEVERELGPDRWAFKDCKLLLVWRNWAREFPYAKWIIVRRDIDQIADSCVATGFMRHYQTREQWAAWSKEYLNRAEELKAEAECIEVWPQDFIDGKVRGLKRMAKHCGLTWNREAVDAVIDRTKWRR